MHATRSLAVVSALILAAAAGAAETPEVRLEKALDAIVAQAKNAEIKLKHGATTFRAGVSEDDDTPPKPGQACCSINVEAIVAEMKTAQSALRELDARFKREGEEQGQEHVRNLLSYLKAIDSQLETFFRVGNKEYADAAIRAARSSAQSMQGIRKQMKACCLPDTPEKNKQ